MVLYIARLVAEREIKRECACMPFAIEAGVGCGKSAGLQNSSSAGTLPPIADRAAVSCAAARRRPVPSSLQASAPSSFHAADPALSSACPLLTAPAERAAWLYAMSPSGLENTFSSAVQPEDAADFLAFQGVQDQAQVLHKHQMVTWWSKTLIDIGDSVLTFLP